MVFNFLLTICFEPLFPEAIAIVQGFWELQSKCVEEQKNYVGTAHHAKLDQCGDNFTNIP